MTTYEHPPPQEFHDAPRYYRRRFSTDGIPEEQTIGGVHYITPQMPPGGIVIYGYSTRSTYAEDLPLEEETWERRRAFPAVSFSVVCPEGEYGAVSLHTGGGLGPVEAITQEQFEAARAAGWQPQEER